MTNSTNFVDEVTLTRAAWFNDVDDFVYGTFPSVKYYGTNVGTGGDDTAAFILARAANPNGPVFIPKGSYIISSPVVSDTAGSWWIGQGHGVTQIHNTGTNTDAFQFSTPVPTDGTFLYHCGIMGMSIYDTNAARTLGAAVLMVQCSRFTLRDIYSIDLPEGIQQYGGAENDLSSFEILIGVVTAPSANTSLLSFDSNALTGGLYQQAWTTNVSHYIISGAKKAPSLIHFGGCDGIQLSNGYASYAKDQLVLFKPTVSGVNVSGVHFSTSYLDGVSQTTGTTNGIRVANDGFAGASLINDISFDRSCTIANLTGKGVYSDNAGLTTFSVEPGSFFNIAGAKFDMSGGGTTGIENIAVAFTPSMTFATPGDLSLGVPTKAVGFSTRVGNGVRALVDYQVIPTFSTSSGDLRITGFPVNSTTTSAVWTGAVAFGGVTKAGYTNFTTRKDSNNNLVTFEASGSGVALSTITAADLASGATFTVHLEIWYEA